jgi:hypothetical protein
LQSLIYKIVKDRSILESIVSHYITLAPLKPKIKTAYRNYIIKKASPSLPPILVSKEQSNDLSLAYTSRPEAAKLKWINEINYNGLLSCPFCGGDGARTIEHYLPQASYPEFSVFSLNLLPSCGDCNRKRNDSNKYGAAIQLLHPYFDRMLIQKIEAFTSINLQSGVPSFYLDYDRKNFDDSQQERIDHHIITNIDEISFLNKTLGELEALKIESEKYSSYQLFLDGCISEKIYIYTRVGAINSWGQALCRGILRLSGDEIDLIFKSHFGRRLRAN